MNVMNDGAHYTLENVGTAYRFSMSYRKEWWRIVSYGVSAAVVVVILVPVSLSVLFEADPGQVPFEGWLLLGVALAFGVGLGLLEMLWQLVGKEVVDIDDDALVIRHQILGLGPAKKLASASISGLRVSPPAEWAGPQFFGRRDYRFFNFKRGSVALNSGKSMLGRPVTYRFGTNLDEVEAGQVVAQILGRFPQYRTTASNV